MEGELESSQSAYMIDGRRQWSSIVLLVGVIGVVGLLESAMAQSNDPGFGTDRIPFEGGSMFLSGANVAWVTFARDIGPGSTELRTFDEIFRQVGEHGGNTMRLWLHTNGRHTPEWGPDSTVVGAGEHAIADLRNLLDAAREHQVGLVLCLWSFDMLRETVGDTVVDRNEALLRDSARTQTYVENALIPMVEAVGDHPAVVAWEIFNEPEGMSEEFGWDFTRHVPMVDIQRFVNQTAAGIHRADEDALVTNGAWAFTSMSDRAPTSRAKRLPAEDLSRDRIHRIRKALSHQYRHDFTVDEARAAYERHRKMSSYNYYKDERLIEKGGEPEGVLDFYSVHYYDWAGTGRSPFHIDADYWKLEKPIAVMEFHMEETLGVPQSELYKELLRRGYAGASAWSWTDMSTSQWRESLALMKEVRETYAGAVLPDSTVDGEITPPVDVVLHSPRPNPVTTQTQIVYDLRRKGPVELALYDALGRRVATLVDARQDADR